MDIRPAATVGDPGSQLNSVVAPHNALGPAGSRSGQSARVQVDGAVVVRRSVTDDRAPRFEAMERYRDRCMTLVIRLDGVLAAETLNQAQHLIDHGEPSLGVEYLAWGVTQQDRHVPAELIGEMRELVMDQDQLPPDLDAYAAGK